MFKRFWWVFLVMIPVGSILGLLVAAVVTYVMPKKYESGIVIEVKPLSGEEVSPKITPQFFGTEFVKIKSSNSLGKVVDNLELINKWGVDKETAIGILKGIVTTQNIRGTDLISIQVRHINKEDARDITAEVAKTYRDYRMETMKRGEGESLLELEKSVRDQEDKVEERRKVVSNILKTRGMIDKTQDYIDAKRDFETEQALLQSLKLKLINEVISAQLQEGSVVIHEEPQIAQTPISPNVPLNLMLGTALGLLLSPLLSLPVILLLSRLRPAKVPA